MIMKIELGDCFTFRLASIFAATVLAMVCRLHLRASGALAAGSEVISEEYREMRAAIRSIPPGWERRQFISHIRFMFAKLRDEAGYHVTTRAYVESVEDHKRRVAEVVGRAAA